MILRQSATESSCAPQNRVRPRPRERLSRPKGVTGWSAKRVSSGGYRCWRCWLPDWVLHWVFIINYIKDFRSENLVLWRGYGGPCDWKETNFSAGKILWKINWNISKQFLSKAKK